MPVTSSQEAEIRRAINKEEGDEFELAGRIATQFGYKGLMTGYVSPDFAIGGFSELILERAREVSEEAQRHADRWKGISFVLYPLGLIIGLLSRIYGEESAEMPDAT